MTRTTKLLVLCLLASVLAVPVSAAELSLQTPLAAVESPFLIPVTFTTDTESINTIEGSISIPEGITIDSIDTSGSAFSLFAEGPVYDLSSNTIAFTAGAPGGIAPDNVALVFVIKGHTSTVGSYSFVPKDVSAYKNDGTGTRIAVSGARASLSVGEKGSVEVDAFPPSAPTPLIAEVGKDDSLFGGKLFLTFYGGASGSSVDHYEVREGWWRLPIRADRYYLLKDQNQGSTIWVTAISNNGKSVTKEIPAVHPWTERILTAVLILLLGAIGGLIWRRFFRRTP